MDTTDDAPNSLRRYLYAIIQCGDALTLDGSDDPRSCGTCRTRSDNDYAVPLRIVPHQEIGAVVGDLLPGKGTVTPENVLRHERIIEQLMRRFTLLPVRFGTVLANDWEVETLLAARYEAWQRNLKRVANRVELEIKILWPEEEIQREIEASSPRVERIRAQVALAAPGKNYLLKRMQEQVVIEEMRGRALDLSETIHRALLADASEGTSDSRVSPGLVMSAHYLVERAKVERFHQVVAGLESEWRDPLKGTFSPKGTCLHFLCSGPWPPYNFIDREASPPGPLS